MSTSFLPPKGTILAWYARSGSVPAGWAICDGSNGTPDLRGKFIMGGSDMADVGQTGGGKLQVPVSKITTYANGWNFDMTEYPNGGPSEGQDWGNRRWHQLKTEGYTHAFNLDVVPAYVKILYIMKL